MIPVADRVLSGVRGSHRAAVRARVVPPGQSGADPDGVEVPILGGKVTLDATASVRGRLDLTTDGRGWHPHPGEPLTPYGNEVFVERGLHVGGGVEYVPLGYFRVYSVEQDDAPYGTLRVLARDRISALRDAKLVEPVQFKPAASIGSVFDRLVHEVLPDADVDFDYAASSDTLDRQIIAGGDDSDTGNNRFEFLADMVNSRGKILFFDYRGVLVVRTPPDPDEPVFTIDAGPGGVMVSGARGVARDGVYNGVVATGEGADSDEPIRAFAYDANPDSPTYWYGPFGKVPTFYSSPMITAPTHALTSARAILRRSLGLPYGIDFDTVPAAFLEPYDPLRVTYTDGQTGVHVLEKLTIPLTAASALSGTTKEQSTINIGVEVPI